MVSGMDLVHALRSSRINTKDRDSQIATALAVVNDLDLLPPSYRDLAEQQANAALVPAAPMPAAPTRQARSL
jgi:hypothetical protein